MNVRYVQVFWLGVGMMLTYAARANLSVAIVSMTDVNATSADTFNWTTAQKGSLLGSFFYGYVLSGTLYGFMAYHLSPRLVLVVNGLVCGLATILFPVMSLHVGYTASFICRIILGLGEGPFYACTTGLISNWAAQNERSRMLSFITSGASLGQAIMMASTGVLSASAAGWPSSFYISGACLLLWGILCLFVVVDSPSLHKSISQEEKLYIEFGRTYNSHRNRRVPWLKFLQCVPFWAVIVCGLSYTWGYWTLQTMVPTYLKGVHHFDITKNGLLSGAFNLSTFCTAFMFPCIDATLKKKFDWSLTTHRKIWSSVVVYGCGIILLILSFVNVSPSFAVTLLVVANAILSASSLGFMCCVLDLSPNFAGVVVCFTSGFMNITSIVGPTIAGLLIQDENNLADWQRVFLTASLIFLFGNTVFLIFGSSIERKWNVDAKEKDPQ